MVTPEELKDLCFTARRIAELQEEFGRPISETCKTLRDLASQVESLQADAERYRWLRKEGFYKDFNFGEPFMVAEFDGHDLDAVVDQEISRKQS